MKLVMKKEPKSRSQRLGSPESTAASSSPWNHANKKAGRETLDEAPPAFIMTTDLAFAASDRMLLPSTPPKTSIGCGTALMDRELNSLSAQPRNDANACMSQHYSQSEPNQAGSAASTVGHIDLLDPLSDDFYFESDLLVELGSICNLDSSTLYDGSENEENIRPFQGSPNARPFVSSLETAAIAPPTSNGCLPDLPFGVRLWQMVDETSCIKPHILRWTDDGTAFYLSDADEFRDELAAILNAHSFTLTKFKSFHRMLNGRGFSVKMDKPPLPAKCARHGKGLFRRNSTLEELAAIAHVGNKRRKFSPNTRRPKTKIIVTPGEADPLSATAYDDQIQASEHWSHDGPVTSSTEKSSVQCSPAKSEQLGDFDNFFLLPDDMSLDAILQMPPSPTATSLTDSLMPASVDHIAGENFASAVSGRVRNVTGKVSIDCLSNTASGKGESSSIAFASPISGIDPAAFTPCTFTSGLFTPHGMEASSSRSSLASQATQAPQHDSDSGHCGFSVGMTASV